MNGQSQNPPTGADQIEQAYDNAQRIQAELGKAVIGQPRVLEQVLIALVDADAKSDAPIFRLVAFEHVKLSLHLCGTSDSLDSRRKFQQERIAHSLDDPPAMG